MSGIQKVVVCYFLVNLIMPVVMFSGDPNTGQVQNSNGKKGNVIEWFVFWMTKTISKSYHFGHFLDFGCLIQMLKFYGIL